MGVNRVPDWHPRQNAYPVRWLLSNGRYADPYAELRLIHVIRGQAKHHYELRHVGNESLSGVFETGDAAAEFAWDWYLRQQRGER
ncbi:hypothetical protein [Schumannella sp. 10F1B-5-1]|uniref:hypothetical protein n=1 Tax=Schumannella sp. 10F1B-5-1 TaxID=2590780 RepID=UPI001130A88A|nr:hypothetical protein [Schumannella sp. 10F1B-5-1]TPW78393.1 hypothetical protein FJ658_00880 [Schumannella sp. 10F1B-5-1]